MAKAVVGAGRLSDLAYQRILEGLFDRRLPAGAFVSQNELVELLGIPVAPLRDALRVLEAEGIVTIHPRSGIQFIKPELELIRSTYQFRTIVESAAVRVYAETADEAELERIAGRHTALIEQIGTEGPNAGVNEELEEIEEMLHSAVIAALANPLIETAYRRMRYYLRLVRLERRTTAPLALRSLREHMEIILACQRRDPDAAEAAVRSHFTASLQRYMGIY